jgi:polar amino acid transport system ATP-binding protein
MKTEYMEPLLKIEGICKNLGGKEIIKNVSLSLNKGDLKVLIGPSGGGKSTLLQCINLLLIPDKGKIFLKGKEISFRKKRDILEFRQQIGMIFQDFNLFDHLTAVDNVSIALRKVKKMCKKEAYERAEMELVRVGLGDKLTSYPAELSGGQKQRVSIARALAMDPLVLLLDEPTSALDPELISEVLNVIKELSRLGMTMLMATHQMNFIKSLAKEVLFMEHGVIVEQDTPYNLLENTEKQTRTYYFCSKLI